MIYANCCKSYFQLCISMRLNLIVPFHYLWRHSGKKRVNISIGVTKLGFDEIRL